MQHTENIRAVLKAANLSEGSELDADQLGRAEFAVERRAKEAEEGIAQLSGPALANFIMKGGKGSGRPAGKGGRVPGKMSMHAAAKLILGRAKGPLHAHEVAKRALDQGLIETKGATPEQTMAARLAVGTRKGEFKRTAPNTFTLPGKKAKAAKAKPKAKATAGAAS